MSEDIGPFRAMAIRIERNTDSKFGGAYVIVPPGENVPPLEVLVLDTRQDPAQFFMLLKAKIDTILAEIDLEERRNQGFGR